MWARGESAVPPYLVMPLAFTPARAKRADAVSPAGPAPTTSTSVSIKSIDRHSRFQIRPYWYRTSRLPHHYLFCRKHLDTDAHVWDCGEHVRFGLRGAVIHSNRTSARH